MLIIADSLNAKGSKKATWYYKQALIKDTTNIDACFKLAAIYHQKYIISQYNIETAKYTGIYAKKAESYFLKCIDLCPNFKHNSSQYYLGELYFLEKNYSLSSYFFKQYISYCKSVNKPINKNALNYYGKCKLWEDFQNNVANENFGALSKINTSGSEKIPAISHDATTILYKKRYNKQHKNSMFSVPVEEIFISEIVDVDSISNPIYGNEKILFEYDKSEKTYISSYCLSSNKKEIYFSMCRKIRLETEFVEDCDIYVMTFDGYTWGNARPIKQINKKFTFEAYPSLSPDMKKLYFVSNNYEGYGGKDIFCISKNEQNEWGKPVNLGSKINTINDEIAPFICYDNETMYFSSNGHFGLGGFDIFCTKGQDSTWTKPKNLGKPYNSANDELCFVTDASGVNGYTYSKQNSAFGGNDILKIKINKNFRSKPKLVVSVKVQGTDKQQINLNIKDLKTNKKIRLKRINDNNIYSAVLKNITNTMLLQIEDKGFIYANKIINKNNDDYFVVEKINLIPIIRGVRFKIDEISTKKTFKTFSKTEQYMLNDFSRYLVANNLKIKIFSLANSNEETEKNEAKKRGMAVCNYLINNGVEASNISVLPFSKSSNSKYTLWFQVL